SIRDALIASTTLDILNKHSDRVRIANIAQTVNVLQAMILTDGSRMLKTPTYHVFDFYRVHHDAMLLPLHLNSTEYAHDGESIPAISATASKDSSGAIHITATNLHAGESQEVTVDIRGRDIDEISNGRILSGDAVDAINTFDHPNRVSPRSFEDFRLSDDQVTLRLPSKSVIVLRME